MAIWRDGSGRTRRPHGGGTDEYDPMLDPLHMDPRSGAARRSPNLDRVLPWLALAFVLAPLVQYLVHEILSGR